MKPSICIIKAINNIIRNLMGDFVKELSHNIQSI